MANMNPLRVVIEGVDRITAPLRRINRRIESMTAPIRQVNNSLRSMGEAAGIGRLGSAMGNVGNRVANATREVGALGARLGAVGAVAAGTFGILVNGYSRSANEVSVWSERLGMSTQSLQEWQYVAGQFNVENDALRDGLKELTMRADEFVVTGGGPAAEAFERIGVSQARLRETGGDTEKIFALIRDRIRDIDNVAKRQRIVDELLGGQGGEQMTVMLSSAASELERMHGEAHRLGEVMDEGTIAGAARFTNGMRDLTGALSGARNAVLGPLMPALTELAATLKELLVDNRERLAAFGEALAERLPGALERLIEGFRDVRRVMDEVLDFIRPITDRFGGLRVALVTVAAVLFGPLLAALAGVTQAMVSLGVALLTTPVGWFLGAVAAIAGAVYLIYRHWDDISRWFTDKIDAVRSAFDTGLLQGVYTLLREFNPVLLVAEAIDGIVEYITGVSLSDIGGRMIGTLLNGIRSRFEGVIDAFDQGLLQGIYALLRDFNPVTLVAEAIDAIVEYITGVSLSDVGADLIDSLWQGIGDKFDELTRWFREKVRGLTELVPDWMKDAGSAVSDGVSRVTGAVGEAFSGEARPTQYGLQPGPPRALAETVRGATGANGQGGEASVTMRFENAPQGLQVVDQQSRGLNVSNDLGYSLEDS
ncbi:hypothetical protein NFH98_20745 [Halomonas sp. H33-56]|uniref:hypothetical protein n=1 Tax=Halomonas sp. H33-56 TaxID=2950873 RepID=UPI0032DE6750